MVYPSIRLELVLKVAFVFRDVDNLAPLKEEAGAGSGFLFLERDDTDGVRPIVRRPLRGVVNQWPGVTTAGEERGDVGVEASGNERRLRRHRLEGLHLVIRVFCAVGGRWMRHRAVVGLLERRRRRGGCWRVVFVDPGVRFRRQTLPPLQRAMDAPSGDETS